MIIGKKQELFQWTNHCRYKMRFYGLSESRIKRVINFPKRIEEGITPDTVAMMQPAGTEKHPYEIWVMIQKTQINADDNADKRRNSQRKSAAVKVISVWRYPGKTKPRSEIALDFLKREYGDYAGAK